MQVNFSLIAALSAALLLLPGTTGCRSNGGPWYNPSTYAFSNPFASNPFAKDGSLAPPFSADALAESKPSLGSNPNIGLPPGGYTDGSIVSNTGTPSTNPPERWGESQNAMSALAASANAISSANAMPAQGHPGFYSGYSVPEASQYSPSHADAFAASPSAPGIGAAGFTTQTPPGQSPHLYQPDSVHHASANPMIQNYQPTALQQHAPSNPMPGNVPLAANESWEQSQHHAFGGMQQPHTIPPGTMPPGGFVYEQAPSQPHAMPTQPMPGEINAFPGQHSNLPIW